MTDLGRALLLVGIVLAAAGAALLLVGRLHLPGDLTLRRGGVTIYLPLATSLVLSVILTLVLNFVLRRR